MAFSEQFILKLGVDNRALASGLRGLKNQVGAAMSGVKDQIAGAFTIGGAVMFFNKVINHFDEIKDRAENLNVGTDFFQGMGRTFATSGSSAEKFAAGLDKLNIKIGEAKGGNKQAIESFQKIGISLEQLKSMSAEEVFYAVSDGLKATGDNALIAAGAVDIFGKSGASMVAVMNEGSEKLKENVKKATKLDADDVKALGDANDKLKDIGETSLVVGAKVFLGLAHFPEALRDLFRMNVSEARHLEIVQEVTSRRALETAKTIAKVDAEFEADKLAALKKEQDITNAIADKRKLDADEAAAQAKKRKDEDYAEMARIDKKGAAMFKAMNKLKEFQNAQSARTDWTLSEIANLDPNDLSRENQWKIGAAQDVQWMRDEARFARLQGNDAYATNLISQSDRLAQSIGGLSASEADPLGALREQAAEQTEILKGLGACTEANALRIIVANSQ